MKKLVIFFIFLTLSGFAVAQTANPPSAGDGTVGNPYQIANLENLFWITAPDSIVPVPNQAARQSSHYVQTNHTDASLTQNWYPDGQGGYMGWLPIGSFSGSYDGGNFSISELFINRSSGDIGLFGHTAAGSEINNLSLIDVDITSTGNVFYTGSLVAWCFGSIDNCHASGDLVSSANRVGGLIGELYFDGVINNSSYQGTVSGINACGLVGLNRGTILDSNASVIVNCGSGGGLTGSSEGLIDGCHATGTLTANGGQVAGLVTVNWGGTISNSFSAVDVGSTYWAASAGGLVMENRGLIIDSYATGNVTGGTTVGGLVADNFGPGGIIESSYSAGNVVNSGSFWTMYAGGLAGINSGSISNSYSRSNVYRNHNTATIYFGGFVGKNHQGIIENCYSTGWVAYLGPVYPDDKGFAGGVDTGGNYLMSGNYWDMETSFQYTTAGEAEGRLTSHMTSPYSIDTFVNWDFVDTWEEDFSYTINNGYPFLQMQFQVPHPIINVTPDFFEVDLTVGETLILPMIISNEGDADLVFSIDFSSEDISLIKSTNESSYAGKRNRENFREDWLSAIPLTGVVSAGSNVTIDVCFDAGLLNPGIFITDIIITNNAQDNVIVPVELTVTGTVAVPTFSPDPGLFTSEVDVSIATATPDAIIFYRTSTNGGVWTDWQIYTTPITVPLDTAMDFEAYAEKPDWITSAIATANYIITGTVATPEFDPGGGIFLEPQVVTILTATIGATIEYSFDGQNWIAGNTADIGYSTMLYARAFLENWLDSDTCEDMYYILNPPQELAAEGLAGYVHLSWLAPIGADNLFAEIRNSGSRNKLDLSKKLNLRHSTRKRETDELIGYNVYRLEGADFVLLNSEPITGTEYDDEELAAGEYTYRVTAVYDEGESLPSNTAVALINMLTLPQFSPVPGYYQVAIDVSITCANDQATIFYTLDGSEPTQSSLLYIEPIHLENTVLIRTRAFLTDWLPSEIAEGYYEINITGNDDLIVDVSKTLLHVAYPNPFNPVTTIEFSIREGDSGTLTIFNITGQKILEKEYPAGNHLFHWNADDQASGVYFYQLKTPSYNKINKALLLK